MDMQTWLLLGILGVVCVAVFFAYIRTRRADGFSDTPTVRRKHKRLPVLQRCDTCAHWDLEEGQAAMRKHPIFAYQVAAAVPPSRMMERYGDDHEIKQEGPALAHKEDRWDLFGACEVENKLTHASYKCSAWLPAEKRG